jgi:hypothetical protein
MAMEEKIEALAVQALERAIDSGMEPKAGRVFAFDVRLGDEGGSCGYTRVRIEITAAMLIQAARCAD